MLDALGAIGSLIFTPDGAMFLPPLILSAVSLQVFYAKKGPVGFLNSSMATLFFVYVVAFAVGAFILSVFISPLLLIFFFFAGIPLCGVAFLLHMLVLYPWAKRALRNASQ